MTVPKIENETETSSSLHLGPKINEHFRKTCIPNSRITKIGVSKQQPAVIYLLIYHYQLFVLSQFL